MLNFVVLSLIELYKYVFCQRKALYAKKTETDDPEKHHGSLFLCSD